MFTVFLMVNKKQNSIMLLAGNPCILYLNVRLLQVQFNQIDLALVLLAIILLTFFWLNLNSGCDELDQEIEVAMEEIEL